MSPQLVLTIIGAVNVVMGVAIYVGAEAIVTGGVFSNYLINDASIKVGVYMHEAVASFMIAFGFVAFLSRDLENGSARKLLFAIGIAYVVNLTSVLLHTMNPEVHPPIPAIIITLALAGLSFYTAQASD